MTNKFAFLAYPLPVLRLVINVQDPLFANGSRMSFLNSCSCFKFHWILLFNNNIFVLIHLYYLILLWCAIIVFTRLLAISCQLIVNIRRPVLRFSWQLRLFRWLYARGKVRPNFVDWQLQVWWQAQHLARLVPAVFRDGIHRDAFGEIRRTAQDRSLFFAFS